MAKFVAGRFADSHGAPKAAEARGGRGCARPHGCRWCELNSDSCSTRLCPTRPPPAAAFPCASGAGKNGPSGRWSATCYAKVWTLGHGLNQSYLYTLVTSIPSDTNGLTNSSAPARYLLTGPPLSGPRPTTQYAGCLAKVPEQWLEELAQIKGKALGSRGSAGASPQTCCVAR